MMALKTIFKMIDTETNEQFTGTSVEIASKLGTSAAYVSKASERNGLYKHRYRLTREDVEIGRPFHKNMGKELRELDNLHNWYVEFRKRHPKEVEVNE